METTYWRKQGSEPLFPELLWSRPETKAQAGKLLIVGGNQYGFVAPAEAYKAAETARVGTARMVLPDSLKKFVGATFTAGTLAPTTPSGSFSQAALATLLDEATWADSVLLAGDFGRNSETTVLLETFLEKYPGPVTVTRDAADHFCVNPHTVLQRADTLLVLSMGQLQQLGSNAKFARAFTSTMGVVQLVETLHEFTKRFTPFVITQHQGQYVVAVNGQVSTTKLTEPLAIWRLTTASTAAVWWLQNATKPFEALTTAVTSR
jgi:hypothetical protein